jgi:hypothetical protein
VVKWVISLIRDTPWPALRNQQLTLC